MNVKIGNYEIIQNGGNWIVRVFGEKINHKTKEKSFGLKWERFPGTLYQCCKTVLFEGMVKDSEANDIRELMEVITDSCRVLVDAIGNDREKAAVEKYRKEKAEKKAKVKILEMKENDRRGKAEQVKKPPKLTENEVKERIEKETQQEKEKNKKRIKDKQENSIAPKTSPDVIRPIKRVRRKK